MGVVLAILFLILVIRCARKESEVTGLYKTFNVYGRGKAYLIFAFLIAIIPGTASAVAAFSQGMVGYGFIYLVLCGGLFALGIKLYLDCKKNCPAFLQKRLLGSIMKTGLGVSCKLALFFVSSIWDLVAPQEMIDENGDRLIVYDREVYTLSGDKVGVMTGTDTYKKTVC